MRYPRMLVLPCLWMLPLAIAGLAVPTQDAAVQEKPQALTDRIHHIGNTEKPEWKEFTTVRPEHPSHLRLEFAVEKKGGKHVLEVRAGGVGDVWKVKLNHHDLGALKVGEAAQTQYFDVAPEHLKDVGNELSVECARPDGRVEDDVFVGPIVLHNRPLHEILRFARVSVVVLERAGEEGIPCRLTITRLNEIQPKDKKDKKDKKEEELAEVTLEEHQKLAVRRGVIYTLDGKARFEVPAGRYRIYATRGFEYGLASATLDLGPSAQEAVQLRLEQEVDVAGYLAADTHIHTKTYSGHGDASVGERLATIAGEGVEVAIATDHNHHTDYAPRARELGIQDRFLSVIGNEFTTVLGHFNAFPVEKGARPPASWSKNWVKLIECLRSTPGVRVIICNHPRRPKSDEEAFNNIALNPLSGEADRGPPSLGIDAVEVINAKGLHEDELLTFRDWFALLNHGYRVAGVAGSDSHTVEGIVGQSRTYVRSSARDPSRAEVSEIADSFLAGRLLISMGLLAEVQVDGRFGVGDLATGLQDNVDAEITVRGPRWSRADKVSLYLNGQLVREERIRHADEDIVKYHSTWRIARPAHDAFLVVIATGPAITAPYWALAVPKRYTLGATNPVWLDCDGDGRFTSAFEYARRLVQEDGDRPAKLHRDLEGHDAAVSVQAASMLRRQIQSELQAEYDHLLATADRKLGALLGTSSKLVNLRFQDYLKSTPPLDVVTRREQMERVRQERSERAREEKEREDAEKKKVEAEKKRRADQEKARGKQPPPTARSKQRAL